MWAGVAADRQPSSEWRNTCASRSNDPRIGFGHYFSIVISISWYATDVRSPSITLAS